MGAPRFSWRDEPVSPGPRKVSALLICLSLRREGLSRGELAELLWGVGRLNNLRHAVHVLRRLPGAGSWLQDGDPLSITVHSDLSSFESAVEEGEYERALRLWQGPLLDRFEVSGATAFTDMVEFERSRVRTLYLDALEHRALALEHAGDPEAALGIVDELLRHDNLSETAYRSAMRLERDIGNLDGALARYEACRRMLHEEFGVEPLAETNELFAEIEASLTAFRANERAREPSGRVPLLFSQDAFVGRRKELAAIDRLLEDPQVRLVSLTGPGGVGKTRLALEAMARQSDAFPQGSHYVPLAPIGSARLIPSAIASALGFTFSGDQAVDGQLVDYLREKSVLLVIDNFEHVPDGADLLLDLIEACPSVKLLVTSREPLGLTLETRIEVEGLSHPRGDDDGRQRYDAVRLFQDRARRAVPSFRVDDDNRSAVTSIARLLDGMPLGIELAAAWVGSLTPAEIAHDIESSLDSIARDSPEIPQRHRSLRSVFEHSWSLLSNHEREALAKFSVFRGGCSRAAVTDVANASLRSLLSLVDKSLLRRTEAGRFEMLEVVRQYAAEKLHDETTARDAHCTYYADLLAGLEPELAGSGRPRFMALVSAELDNVRAAWRWAVERRHIGEIDRSTEALFRYYDIRALNAEALELFESAAEAVRADPSEAARATLARLTLRQGVFMNRLARFEEARQLLRDGLSELEAEHHDDLREEAFAYCALGAVAYKQDDNDLSESNYARALDLYRRAGDDLGEAMALDGLGTSAFVRGEYQEAERFYQRCLDIGTSRGDQHWMLRGYKNVGMTSAVLGRYEHASEMLASAVEGSRDADDRSILAGSLNNLGRVQHLMGEFGGSESSFAECLELHQDAGNTWGRALASSNLGVLRYDQRDLEGAREHLEAALESFQRIENQRGVVLTLSRLGDIALEEGDDRAALDFLVAGLRLGADSGHTSGTLALVCSLAELDLHAGDVAGAAARLALVAAHPSTEAARAERATNVLADIRQQLPADVYATATLRGRELELADVVTDLLARAAP